MLKELFEKEKISLNHFFDCLNLNAAEELLHTLRNCKGLMIFTGIGKSGLVAEKIAMTMTSTGSRAFYLSPTNALHGDIGMVTDQDVFVMLSKSGESDELLHMIPYLRNKKVKLAAIVNNPNSRLGKACDLCVPLPMEKELCPFDLAPTTSTVMQMIFGDVLAIALMSLKNFSLAEYVMNHPAGKIGKQLTLKVKDLMLTSSAIPLCSPQDKLVDTLVELSNKRCGCVLIVDHNYTLMGIFTDGDLGRALQTCGSRALESTMLERMTKTPRSIGPEELATQALAAMEFDQKCPITVLPVVDENRHVVGLIKMHDIVQSGL
jgi:arabinose-5-phosphate isomerase